MPYFVYVLKSEKTGKTYTGHTAHLEKRLVEHNTGKSLFTKRNRPWKLIFHEEYDTRSKAMLQEKYYKSREGRLTLKALGLL